MITIQELELFLIVSEILRIELQLMDEILLILKLFLVRNFLNKIRSSLSDFTFTMFKKLKALRVLSFKSTIYKIRSSKGTSSDRLAELNF
ncbi:hypothetical protein BpHYR1_041660 [Brachionus plicatilis]|uniref:Uncharacterized protein n=1 Tax=Brachionus plicatilis TaxID=10195 RepID=A0A3M7ST69_BRAPC|nr:hypothetical protein BpHYR1_041660 [Brachionus plicatilis]